MKQKLNLFSVGALHLLVCAFIDSLLPDSGPQMAVIGAIASMAAPILLEKAFGQKGGASQQALRSPEQAAAQRGLLDFAQTGKFGGMTMGEEVPLGYGDYNATGLEQQGLGRLKNLLDSGIPEQYKMGEGALQDFLQTDPQAIDNLFQPFKTEAERSTREAVDATKRNQAFAGNLYSTDTMERLGDVRARGNETLISQLAQLTDRERGRKLSAIPLAFQGAESGQGLGLGQVAASQQYGSLSRDLNTQSIQTRDAELLRRRQEQFRPLEALQAVAGMSSEFGVPSVQTSPYRDLLSKVGQAGGDWVEKKWASRTPKTKFTGETLPAELGGYRV